MRFLHTADWHLGRLFYGERLTRDQDYVLQQVIDVAQQARVDAVLVSGDIYDRAVPPPEAIALLDDVLSRLVLGLKVPVIIIAGNHDSPERLGFGARLLQGQRLHVVGGLSGATERIVIADAHGTVDFYAVPYAEPQVTREQLHDETISDHDGAMKAFLRSLRPPSERAVLLAHAFVVGGEECESERPLSLGGAGSVHPGCFAGFSYVALGHLHRPQRVSHERIQYAGSLLKYSFSEVSQPKSVTLVEMDAQGNCTLERVPLQPRRDVRRIEGYFADLLQGAAPGAKDDYLLVTLLDEGPVLDPMSRLKAVYPGVLHIDRPYLAQGGTGSGAASLDYRRFSDRDLFAAFYAQATGEDLTPAQDAALVTVLEQLEQQAREASA